MKLTYCIVLILCVLSCSNDADKNKSEKKLLTQIEKEKVATDWKDTVDCHGFLGNNQVVAQLIFNEKTNEIKGSYFYQSNKGLKFNIFGKADDWYGGWNYKIEEKTIEGKLSGTWSSLRSDIDDAYKARYHSSDGKINTEIVLLPNSSSFYLDTNSKMVFNTKNDCLRFFKYNQFLHNEIKNKGGMIVSPEPINTDNQIWLPKGISIYQQDGGDFASFEPCGKIETNNLIKYDNGKSTKLSLAMENYEAVGYDEYRLRFDDVITPEYISIKLSKDQIIYISIKELNNKGWFLIGDCSIFKNNSGKVMGYYPDYELLSSEIDYGVNSSVTIFKKKMENSRKLVTINDELGFFSILDVVYYNGEYWANVKYEYYTEIPCEGTPLVPKTSVNGWIKFYKNNRVCLRHYSKGC